MRPLLAPLLLLIAPPLHAQETSVMGFLFQATNQPPRTRAEVEALLLNHPMTEIRRDRYAEYIVTVRTTDGAITQANFIEPVTPDAPLGPSLRLEISGECYSRRGVLAAFPQTRPNPYRPGVWEVFRGSSGYYFEFDDQPGQCLTVFVVFDHGARRPAGTG